MATLDLGKIWLNDLTTGESVSAYSSNRSFNNAVDGEVRTYASGRVRASFATGSKQTFSFTLRGVTTDDLATLKAWRGETLVCRDHVGHKFYGVFFEMDYTDYKATLLYDVNLTFTEVTYQEEV